MSFGITISLTEKTTEEVRHYLEKMKALHADLVFTTLRLPGEDKEAFKECLAAAGRYIKEHFRIFAADVSPSVFSWISPEELKEYGVTTLRIDNGIPEQEIADLSKQFQIVLNASTIDDTFLDTLRSCGYQGEFQAWHNYYPRKHTGLDERFYEERGRFMRQRGICAAAFIAGDAELRGTIFEGLPTLEKHRDCSPVLAFLELRHQFETETVILGDFDLQEETFEKLKLLLETGTIRLRAEMVRENSILNMIHHNRVDVAADVIRSNEYRRINKRHIAPANAAERPVGAITIDNEGYGRYMGEMQIVLTPLPADGRVNVAGVIVEEDLPLLSYIKTERYPFVIVASGR